MQIPAKLNRSHTELGETAALPRIGMHATSLALDHLLRAVNDPLADACDLRPDEPEFIRAQTVGAAAGMFAKAPDTFPAIAQAIRAANSKHVPCVAVNAIPLCCGRSVAIRESGARC
jgi:hypothetical protein